MAAIDPTASAARDEPVERTSCGSIVLAALSLPGLLTSLLPATVRADSAPEHPTISFKTEHYQDSQPGFQRIRIDEPALYGLLPIGEHFSLAGSAVYDVVSGASPRYYTTTSGASRVHEKRYSGDVEATYYAARSSYGIGYAHSQEHDYTSNSVSADAVFATADNNTAVNLGLSGSRDSINPTNQIVSNEHRTTYAGIIGITQALSATDLVQLQAGYSTGHGYFSDAYKLFDNRPRRRNSETGSVRWNHHFADTTSTLRTSYRFYHDTYGIFSHTVDLQWVQPVGESWVLTPGLRYFTQSAATFYIDPPANAPFPTVPEGSPSSLDQRLSAFGAFAVSQKAQWNISAHLSADLRGEFYQARSNWRFIGNGSPGLDTFQYYQIQFGVTYRF